MELEICCGDLRSVNNVVKGGGTRIEFCSGLSEGGLTPSLGSIIAAAKTGLKRLNVLIRPRSGDFLYSEDEVKLMCEDIALALKAGATGIVIGALTPEGEIDKEAMKRFMAVVNDFMEKTGKKIYVTFHRAFDVSKDPIKSLEDIISLGCDSILTSGMASSASAGTEVLRQLVEKAQGRIEIIAGAGVNIDNVKEIIKETGVGAVHCSLREKCRSRMDFHRETVKMGNSDCDEYECLITSPVAVGEMIKILQK